MRTTKAACGFDFGRYECHCCCEVSFCNKIRSCSVVKRLWPRKVLDLSAAEYVPATNDERPRMATQHSHEIPHCIKAENSQTIHAQIFCSPRLWAVSQASPIRRIRVDKSLGHVGPS